MKITCPVCSTSYMVPDTAFVSGKSRKVKCASCGHGWNQEPPSNPSSAPTTDISEEAVKKSEEKGTNVPAIKKSEPVPRILMGATITLIIFAYVVQNFFSYSEGLGFYDSDGLVFQEMGVEVKREANNLVAYITGEIRNDSIDKEYTLPQQVFFKVFSGQNRVMAETAFNLPEKTLMPGESIAFTPRIGNISGNAKKLVLDLGNSLERSYRE